MHRLDTFDRVFAWTLTVAVVGSGCLFVLTSKESIGESVLISGLCTACVYWIWAQVRKESRKFAGDRERDLFLDAVVAVWREVDLEHSADSDRLERLKNIEHLSWIRYRRFIDRSAR